MNNSVGVQVIQRVHQLLGYLPDLTLRKVPVVLQYLKELALSELSYHAKLMRSFERI